jgi:rhodanese-related sulfurtransferase
MKINAINFSLITIIAGLFLFPPDVFSENPETSANKYKTISATACDSLIKANEKNPNFVILDVRTPNEWKSDHLSGSINRNYYDADINAQLSALPKAKIFLLYCLAGSRSAPTLVKMKNLNFSEVYEMSGGINAWKSKSLPTTTILAPRLMLVSNGGLKNGTIRYGMADTLDITLTNRANDTLKFNSVTFPEGNEFSCNFDLKRKLKGSDDYTFSVYYKPQQLSKDSVHVGIVSNGGTLTLSIILKMETGQENQILSGDEPKIYPNPASSFISFENIWGTTIQEVALVNINGQLIRKEIDFQVTKQFRIADLPEGIYLVRMVTDNRISIKKLIVSR